MRKTEFRTCSAVDAGNVSDALVTGAVTTTGARVAIVTTASLAAAVVGTAGTAGTRSVVALIVLAHPSSAEPGHAGIGA